MINNPVVCTLGTQTRQGEGRGHGSSASLLKPLVCASFLLASAAAAAADNPPVTTQIVDLANKMDGVHPGFRAFHAKGIVVEGSFKASQKRPSSAAQGYSAARRFR